MEHPAAFGSFDLEKPIRLLIDLLQCWWYLLWQELGLVSNRSIVLSGNMILILSFKTGLIFFI